MTDDDQTVADVLRKTGESETIPLLEVATGVLENPEALDYEDWVRPMKLTGGRVCLMTDKDSANYTAYWEWRPEGMFSVAGPNESENPDHAISLLREVIDRPDYPLEPVLREDTPFGEEDSSMPMFNLNNDDVEESLIEFTAGEPGELGLYIHGEENCTVHLHKSENAVIWWRPDRADEEDAWGDSK